MQKCDNLVDIKKMLQNEYLVAKIGRDAEENEPSKVLSFPLKNTEFDDIESFNLGCGRILIKEWIEE